MNIVEGVEYRFVKYFGRNPLIVRSPGRVNLIGEHTDYNNGFVLPAAIDKSIIFAVAPRADNKCRLHAEDLNADYEFDLTSFQKNKKTWPNYLLGVVDQLKKMVMQLVDSIVCLAEIFQLVPVFLLQQP